jgi:LPS export ABC transporter permease LptF
LLRCFCRHQQIWVDAVLNTVDRYILREICVPFFLGLGLFFTVIAFAQVLRVSDAVTGLGVTSGEVLQALMYSLPPLLGLLIPVSCLFASLLGIGRLSCDRELAGLSSVGVSPYALLRIPALLGLVLALLSGLAMHLGEPWGIAGLRELMGRSAQRALSAGVQPQTFHEWIPGITFWAGESRGQWLVDVVFADRRDPQRPMLITARQGLLRAGDDPTQLVFDMRDGTVYLRDTKNDASRLIGFETSLYRLDVARIVGHKSRTLSAVQEMDAQTLYALAHDAGQSAERRALYQVTLHRKFAVPLATFIFALLAVPFGCDIRGGARARGLLTSTVIVGAYYYIGRTLELSARAGQLSPVLAAWLPDLLGTAILLWSLWRLRRRTL